MKLRYLPWNRTSLLRRRWEHVGLRGHRFELTYEQFDTWMEAFAERPWIPNGPVPHQVIWRLPGYEPVGHFFHPTPRSADSERDVRSGGKVNP